MTDATQALMGDKSELNRVTFGDFDVTEAVILAAAGKNKLAVIEEKIKALAAADEAVPEDERADLAERALHLFKQFGLWIPEVAHFRLHTKFVTHCPVCSLHLASTEQNNLFVVDLWRGEAVPGPLQGKARWLACVVCDLLIQPLHVVTYTEKLSRTAAKKQGVDAIVKGTIVQGFKPVGALIDDLSEAGKIVRLMVDEELEVLPGMWKASEGILEGYHHRLKAMVEYWDLQAGVKKPEPTASILGPDGKPVH